MLISKINFKNYFNIFLNKKYFKKYISIITLSKIILLYTAVWAKKTLLRDKSKEFALTESVKG